MSATQGNAMHLVSGNMRLTSSPQLAHPVSRFHSHSLATPSPSSVDQTQSVQTAKHAHRSKASADAATWANCVHVHRLADLRRSQWRFNLEISLSRHVPWTAINWRHSSHEAYNSAEQLQQSCFQPMTGWKCPSARSTDQAIAAGLGAGDTDVYVPNGI